MKIFLIGYMGVGKSTIGKKLAAALHLPFIDLDAQIETHAGMKISEIFSQKGEAHFREMESRLLAQHADSEHEMVLSSGGGTPCHGKNIDLMLRSGVVVWLQLSPKIIAARLGQGQQLRPLLSHLSGEELPTYIEIHLKSREPFYAKAHLSADTHNLNSEKFAGLIEKIRAYSR